mmetsp:Transcript_6635/g.15784  ORF Transcript_6635/g.15784 Transcript_6635/m.15784 type:complete len:285 (-) Transcript_6635:356-1210(-)
MSGYEAATTSPAGPSRDLELAKKAYKDGDLTASKAAHEAKSKGTTGTEEEHAGEGSEYIKSLVFGGLDGIITTFAIVCAAVGAGLGNKTVIVMGLANLVADAISMGLGDALSEKAEYDYVKREYDREAWELENHPEGEKTEMVELYEEQGVPKEDAEIIINTMAKYPELFLKHMMNLELEMMAPDPDDNPWKKGAVTFGAFVAFGSVPLLSFIAFSSVEDLGPNGLFGICCLFTAIAIFALGAVKGKFAQANMFTSGAYMLLNGSLAAASSYVIGWGLETLVPE